MKKKILSLVLALSMVLSFFPGMSTPASAEAAAEAEWYIGVGEPDLGTTSPSGSGTLEEAFEAVAAAPNQANYVAYIHLLGPVTRSYETGSDVKLFAYDGWDFNNTRLVLDLGGQTVTAKTQTSNTDLTVFDFESLKAPLTVKNGKIVTATAGSGAVAISFACWTTRPDVTIDDVDFVQTTTDKSEGFTSIAGAEYAGTVTISNCNFNMSGAGGEDSENGLYAISAGGSGAANSLVVQNCTITLKDGMYSYGIAATKGPANVTVSGTTINISSETSELQEIKGIHAGYSPTQISNVNVTVNYTGTYYSGMVYGLHTKGSVISNSSFTISAPNCGNMTRVYGIVQDGGELTMDAGTTVTVNIGKKASYGNAYGFQTYGSGAKATINGSTISAKLVGTDEGNAPAYGIYVGADVYLSGNASISGDTAEVLLTNKNKKFYAHDGSENAYTGSSEIVVGFDYTPAEGDYVVYGVKTEDKEKFSLTDEYATYVLEFKDGEDNLILKRNTTPIEAGNVTFGLCADCGNGTHEYNGKAHELNIVVKDGEGNVLTKGTDYTVTFNPTNITNVGDKTVKIEGIGNYSGEFTHTFTITAKDLTNETVECNGFEVEKNGDTKTLTSGTVTYNGKTLTRGTDYDYAVGDIVVDGTEAKATVTLTFKGNYSGSKTVENVPAKIKLLESMFTFSGTDELTYNGSAHEPTVTANEGGPEENTDYTVIITDNTNAGTATITIEAKAEGTYYFGKVTKTFAIAQKAIADQSAVTIDGGKTEFLYTGEQIKPEIIVKDGETQLGENDYTVSYGANKNVAADSTNEGTITVSFKGNYSGTITVNFDILPIDLVEDGDLISDAVADFTIVDGNARGTITYMGNELNASDYDIAHDASAGTVTITFSDNYGGDEYVIEGVPVKTNLKADMFTIDLNDKTYTGAAIKPEVSISAEGTAAGLTKNDLEVTYGENTNVAENSTTEGTITITSKNDSFIGGPLTLTFDITPKVVNEEQVTLEKSEYTYTGSQIMPEITVKDGDTDLTKAESADAPGDYYVTYGENINNSNDSTRDGSVTITFKGNYSGTFVKKFDIQPVVLVDENNQLVEVEGFEAELFFLKTGYVQFNPVMFYNGKQLVRGVDYYFADDNLDLINYKANFQFLGNFKGICKTGKLPLRYWQTDWFQAVGAVFLPYTGSPQYADPPALSNSAPEDFTYKVIYRTSDGLEIAHPTNVGSYYAYIVATGDKYYGEYRRPFEITALTVSVKVKDLSVTPGAEMPDFEFVPYNKATGEVITDSAVKVNGAPVVTILDANGESIKDAGGNPIGDLNAIWEAIKSTAGTYTIRCTAFTNVSLGGDGAGNYSLDTSGTQQDTVLTIKKAAAPKVTLTISDGADSTTTVSVTKGGTYTLPECTFTAPEGKQFKAWSVNGIEKNVGDTITVTANMTITAIWEDVPSTEPEIPTYTIGGTVREKTADGTETVVVNAVVKLVGKDINVQTTTDENGSYSFENIPVGNYNIVISKTDGKTKTELVTVGSSNVELSVVLPAMNVSSVVTVETTENSPVRGTIVGNLDAEAQLIAEQLTNGTTDDIVVEVDMKIDAQVSEAVDEEVKNNIDYVASKQSENLTFVEIEIIQTITTNSVPHESNIHETVNLLQIVIPFDTENRSEFAVYRYHEGLAGSIGNVQKITEEPNIYGERIVVGDGELTVYARYFSTYAIGYSKNSTNPNPPVEPEVPVLPIIPTNPSFMVSIPESVSGGKVETSAKSASQGTTVTITVTPDKGYELETLAVIDFKGDAVALTNIGGGKYTFVMPQGQVSINATFVKKDMSCNKGVDCPIWPYKDASTTAWYHDGVHYCIDNGLMNGVSTTLFAPNGTTTRAQIVTILWRLEGEPYANYAMSFADVAAGRWYTEAVRWAAANGIVDGYSDTVFAPNDVITREQMAAILWRYCQYKGIDVSVGEETNILSYTDAFDVHIWAMSAMQWACGAGVIGGIADGNSMKLDPTGSATRAQVATMLWRFCVEIME